MAVGLEGHHAGEERVSDNAQAVNIGAAVDLAPARLLRRHERRRANGGADDGVGGVILVEQLGDAEVHEQGFAVAIDHDVAGLDVAVEHAQVVGIVQPLGHLADDRHHVGGRQ